MLSPEPVYQLHPLLTQSDVRLDGLVENVNPGVEEVFELLGFGRAEAEEGEGNHFVAGELCSGVFVG